MKNIYFNVEKSIKDLQKIFENTDGADERLRAFNQEALEEFKKLESESLKELESLKNNEEKSGKNLPSPFMGKPVPGNQLSLNA
ncbi:hypothetical protein HpHA55_28470 [Helicobacter pylori]